MKFFIAILLVVSATAALAADRAIYDLMYLPKAGTNYGTSDLTLYKGVMKEEGDGFDFEGDVTGWGVRQVVGRSVSDSLLLSAELNFTHVDFHAEYDYDDFGSFEGGSTNKGLSDPVFTARFRAIDSEIQFDFIGSFLASFGDSKIDGSTSDNKEGGHVVTLAVQAGKKLDSFQVAGLAKYIRSLESTTEYDDEDLKIKDDAHGAYHLEVNALGKLSEQNFVKAVASVEFTDRFEDDEDGHTSPSTVYTIAGELQHLISENLLLRGGVSLSDYHQNHLDSYRLFGFNAGANYQF